MELMKKDINIQEVVFRLFRELDALSKDLTDPNNVERIRQGIQKHPAIPYATGFLVGNNHLVTNYHLLVNHPGVSEANLLSERDVIAEMEAHFLYERDPLQRKSIEQKTPVIYKFKPDFHYAGSKPELDYVLLQLESLNPGEQKQSRVDYPEAGRNFSFFKLPTIERPETILEPLSPEQIDRLKPTIDEANHNSRFGRIIGDKIPGEVVNIIQHPEGRPKEIVIYNNRVIKAYQDFLVYETDTEPGSSGSPLLNKNWQLIGLHQGAILKEDANEEIQKSIRTRASSIVQDMTEFLKEDANEEIQNFIRTRASCIVQDMTELLKENANEEIQNFIRTRASSIVQDMTEFLKEDVNEEIQKSIRTRASSIVQDLTGFLKEDANEEIQGFIGIRASSIVQDMTEQCKNPKDGQNIQPLQNFLDKWVNSQSQVFIVAGRRDRNQVLPTQDLADTERSLMLNLQQAIKAELEQQLGQQTVVYCNKIATDLDSVIKEVNENSGSNDIAIELVMDSSNIPKQSQLSLYYSNSKPLAREDAKTCVTTYQAASTVKVLSDRETYFGSLGFCNRVTIPSMVLYVGDVNQPKWVEDHLQTLATQLAQGLIVWHGAVGDRFNQ